MFDLDIKVSSNEYFDLIRKLECLTSESEHLKGLNKNQMNTIIDLRNEITDLKKQNGDLCELVGKTKKESKDYEAMRNELRSLQDENAAIIEAYEKLDKRYVKLSHEYFKLMGENAACVVENYRLRRKLDNGCNTCPDMENTKKKNDELRKEVEDLKGTISRMYGGCQRAIELRRLLDELFEIKLNELVYDDEIRQRMKDLRAGAKDLQEQNQILKDKMKKNDELRELIDFKRKQIEEQATTIRDLDKKLTELRAGAKDLQEQNQILKDSIKQLRDECSKKEEDIHYWKTKSDDYWNRRQFWKDKYDVLMTAYKTETADLKKKLKSVCETCDVPNNCVNASEAVLKDADAKIQSANDKAANAKKEAKEAKERAERYREENFVLHRQIDQFKKLNDELIKELARKGED